MTEKLFDTILVANRGEIARRVIRTLRALGIRSVAVYSDADADAPHVREADLAVRIGPAPAAESYLDIVAVLAAAVSTGAQAVHPGYGFLSESVGLARACAERGIVFIGPGTEALEIMGDKARAREHVARHGVPIVPGFDASGLTDGEIADAADATGYPLLVKPSAGGGGKGMEVVADREHLTGALSSARRVAAAAFGDDGLVIERLIRRPRHIEVQVFGDAHGDIIALGERECTLQRRHQKVIEEAPSAGLDESTRDRLLAAAIDAANSVSYRGAGTVEFLVDADSPSEVFFIEMNTRLQVEHPVTEAVTGLDLVALQVRVAAGLPLPAPPTVRGHAVEARIYAEAPARGFLPSTGTVLLFTPPDGVRVDSAIETGSVISGFYDPMIAKVIAYAEDRATAWERLDAALASTVVLGVDTNVAFLRLLCRNERVRAGDLDTGLIETLLPVAPVDVAPAMLRAATQHCGEDGARVRVGAPWGNLPGWRLGGPAKQTEGPAFLTDAGEIVRSTGGSTEGSAVGDPSGATAACEGEGAVWVSLEGRSVRLRPLDRRAQSVHRLAALERTGSALEPEGRAPMPGNVVAVHVEEGQRVDAGTPILSIEAMKMEHPVLAPIDGVVRLLVAVGDQVRRDQAVARMTTEESG